MSGFQGSTYRTPAGIIGMDVSHYQPASVHAKLRPAFVIVKASEGTGTDPAAVAHAAAARQVGALVSAYHFLRSGNGSGQARVFLGMLDRMGIRPSVRVWADFEAGDHPTLHAFLDAVDAAGFPTGIYTGSWWWGPHGSSTCSTCAGRPLWLSGYTRTVPPTPRPWVKAAIWQFTDKLADLNLDGDVTGTLTGNLDFTTAAKPASVTPALIHPRPLETEMTFVHANGWFLIVGGFIVPLEDTRYVPAGTPHMGVISDRQYQLILNAQPIGQPIGP